MPRVAGAALAVLLMAGCRGQSTAPQVSATLLAFAQQPVTVTAGTTIPTITVVARDNAGNVDVDFSGSVTLAIETNPSGGSLAGTATVTATSGVAVFTTLRILKSGIGYTLRATAGALTGSSAAFDITAGAASSLVFTTQPGNTVAGAPIAVTVTAQDSVGNTATGFSGAASSVTVTIGTNGGSPTPGTLSGTTTQTAVNGVATFADLALDKVGSHYTLTAAGTGPAGATSAPFNVAPAAATQLAFVVQPSNATAGPPATIPAVEVVALDVLGNTDTAFNGSIAVAIGANPSGGSLGGSASVAAVKGVATYADLTIDKSGTGYTLRATSGTLNPAASDPFAITAGSAVKLVFTQQPGNAVEKTPITPCVQVMAQDAGGNGASDADLTITLALTPGTGALGATLSGTTGPVAVVAGVGAAQFCDLSIDKDAPGYTLTASSANLPSVTSEPFVILEAPLAGLGAAPGP